MPWLFSYGTLQQDDVQRSTFDRLIPGERDELVGFELAMVRIEDPTVVATSGKDHHPIVKWCGRAESRVIGTAFEISDADLASADRYEVDAYERVATVLASGRVAWVYVDVRFAPPTDAR